MSEFNVADPVSQILDDPAAPAIVERLRSSLEKEGAKRQKFYADIDDDMKIEFVNGEIVVHSPAKKEHADVVGALYIISFLKRKKSGLGIATH